MASHQATKAISLSALQRNNKMIYVSLLVILTFFLFLDYVPGMHAYSAWVTPPVALFLGLAFALSCGQAHPKFNKKVSKYLLQYSVVGLGFGMNLQASLASGKEGMEFTIISVIGTLLIGWVIGRKFLKVDRDTSYLISTGTAICGGSAIAAVGPVLKAKDTEMSVALGTIFILNAIALFVFPVIGHALGMSQQEFGTWAAIAIHDTSSVVGAGAAYVANNLAQAANNITPAAQTVASKMQDVATKGKNGELLSGLVKNTTRIPSLTGTAAYRIPDGLDMSIKVLSEVKNYTGKLSYTSQLKDFVMWSQANGFEMHLYTNAILTGPLQKIVDSGIIKLFPLK